MAHTLPPLTYPPDALEPHIDTLMSLQFKMVVVVGVLGKVHAEKLRHDGQCRPPVFPKITEHRPKVHSRVLPRRIFRQSIDISRLKTDRPMLSNIAGQSEGEFQFALCFMKVIRPLRRMGEVQGPFPVAVALTQNDSFLNFSQLAGVAGFDVEGKSHRMFGRIQDHVPIFQRNTSELKF